MNIAYRFAAAAVDEAARNAASVADEKAQTALDELANLPRSGNGGPDAIGVYADRGAYDDELAGFVYRVNDGTLEDATAGTGTVAWDFVRVGASGWSEGARVTGDSATTVDALDDIGAVGAVVAKAGTEDAVLAAVGLQSADVRAALKAADLAALRTGIGLGAGDNLLLAAAERAKLAGIAAGAEVNPTGTEIVAAVDAELGQTTWQTGGAGLDTTETTLTPGGSTPTTLAWDGAAISSAAPRAMADNLFDFSVMAARPAGGTVTTTTLAGQTAFNVVANGAEDGLQLRFSGDGTIPVTSGEVITIVYVIERVSGTTGTHDFILYHSGSGENNVFPVNLDTLYISAASPGYFLEPNTQAGTKIVDLGGNLYAVHFELEASTSFDDSFSMALAMDGAGEINVYPAYFGKAVVDFAASDGTEIFSDPTDDTVPSATVTLLTDANQATTIDMSGTQLILPAAPGSGVRDITLRATITAGSLVLPGSGVKLFGAAGPVTSDVRIVVRQYGDGSDADLVAIPEAS